MTGKIVVHIGLPKTATTTLQTEIFPALASENIVYGGVFQPRNDHRQNEIYQIFYESIDSGKGIVDVRETLSAFTRDNVTLVISEEMISVSGQRNSWRGKLDNLKRLIEGFDYTLVVTVRDPVQAMFSYYVECYELLSRRYKNDFLACALQDESMEIYHYKTLIKELTSRFDRARLRLISFENIINNELSDLISATSPDRHLSLDRPIGNLNAREREQRYVVINQVLRVTNFLPQALNGPLLVEKRPLKRVRSRLNKIWSKLGRLQVRVKKVKIAYPSTAVTSTLKEALRQDNDVLDQQFGIRYE